MPNEMLLGADIIIALNFNSNNRSIISFSYFQFFRYFRL